VSPGRSATAIGERLTVRLPCALLRLITFWTEGNLLAKGTDEIRIGSFDSIGWT
jgi:hypothetical protein